MIFRPNFGFLISLFGLAPLYRPYRPELVKWPKVGQNGSKIEKKGCHAISDEIPHILMVSSIFFVFGDFSVKFQIFAKSFWSGSPIEAVPPSTGKMAESGSKQVQNRKKGCHAISDKIPHILMVSSIFFTFGDFWSNLRFLLSLFGPASLPRLYHKEIEK